MPKSTPRHLRPLDPFYVYMLVSPNEKIYVGYTGKTPEKRFKMHVKNSKKTERKCAAIENAIRKYGEENIRVFTIYKCWDEQEAKDMEIRLISEHKTDIKEYGYNLTKGGEGVCPNEETREKMKNSSASRVYRTPKGPRVVTATDIEDAIHWVVSSNLNMAKRTVCSIAADLLEVHSETIRDHMTRIDMNFYDARRTCSDEQIEDALHWVMSQDFSSMMNKTLVEFLVGNQFGSDRIVLRRYLIRSGKTLEGIKIDRRNMFNHTEEAKYAISKANTGRKKTQEEIQRQKQTRRQNIVDEYKSLGIDVSDETLRSVLQLYGDSAFKATKFITKDNPNLFNGVLSILKSYKKRNNL